MTTAAPGTRGRLARIAALALATGIAFGAAELTCRLALPPIGQTVLDHHPMHDWAVVDAFAAYRARPGRYGNLGKTVNADGFLSTPELAPTPPPGTLRIAFLGGSSTACTVPALPDERTWPTRVGALLSARLGRPVEVLNAALPGYSTFESYGRLWARARFFHPHVVVVYHGWNDMYWFGDADRVRTWRTFGDDDWSFDRPHRLDEDPGHPLDGVVGWSDLLKRAARTVWPRPLGGEVGGGTGAALASDWDPRAPGIFEENLRLIRAAGDTLGFEVHAAKQATLIVANLPERLRARCRYQLHGFDHDAHVRAYAAVHAAVDRAFPPDRVIDCAPLSGHGPNFVDHVHLSEAGGDAVAARVVDHLTAHSPACRSAAPAPAPAPAGR